MLLSRRGVSLQLFQSLCIGIWSCGLFLWYRCSKQFLQSQMLLPCLKCLERKEKEAFSLEIYLPLCISHDLSQFQENYERQLGQKYLKYNLDTKVCRIYRSFEMNFIYKEHSVYGNFFFTTSYGQTAQAGKKGAGYGFCH